MTPRHVIHLGLLTASLLLSACNKEPQHQKRIELPASDSKATAQPQPAAAVTEPAPADGAREVEWEELIPIEARPDSDLVFKYNNGEIGDDDPRIVALKKQIDQLQKLAPVDKQLHGQRIKIPGFVVPVETDGEYVMEFLLVPYHGACIHVPPPPANQIVYVRSPKGSKPKFQIMDPVWVTGVMKVEKTKNKVAEVSYSLDAEHLETY